MATEYIDPDTYWTISYEEHERWGARLLHLSQDGYYFADELKVVRIHLKNNAGEVFSFALGEAQNTSTASVNTLAEGTKDLRGFYNPRFEVTSTYSYENLFEIDGLNGEFRVRYMFTPYNRDEPHEPTGSLRSSRVYPMVGFTISEPEEIEASDQIVAIRVDYDFDIMIRGNHVNPSKDDIPSKPGSGFQRVGLWQDQESINMVTAGASTFEYMGLPMTSLEPAFASRGVFSRAEKPLQYEVVAEGLRRGEKGNWDNIHQWRDVGVNAYPVSPGTPFALHDHWRWSPSFGDLGTVAYYFNSGGGPQFEGLGQPGGPMVDANLPDHSMKVAIVEKATSDLVLSGDEQSEFEEFEQLFIAIRPQPLPITFGSFSIWHSFSAYRDFSLHPTQFQGTFFVQGLFFAHESSLSKLAKAAILGGAKSEQFIPGPPDQEWVR